MSVQSPDVFDFQRELAAELVTHTNIKQELVITTVDKLKLCLLEHKGHLRSRREWLGPLGVTIALVTSLVAAQFHGALGLNAATWEALFLLTAFAMGGLTIFLVARALTDLRKGGIDKLIDRITARTRGSVSDLYESALEALGDDYFELDAEEDEADDEDDD